MPNTTLEEKKLEASEQPPRRRYWWHWQNLNEHKCRHCDAFDGYLGWGVRHGRCWWHFGSANKTIELCWNLWTHFCHVSMDIDDEDVTFSVAFPPFAFWLSLSTNWPIVSKLVPRKPLNEEHYPGVVVIDERECGVSISGGAVHIHPWSKRSEWVKADPWWARGVSFNINPFEWKFQKHEVRRADGSWVKASEPSFLRQTKTIVPAEPDNREITHHAYQYRLKSGEIQRRIATVFVERREWRPLIFQWTRLFAKVRTTIDVVFDDEVGERTGSWKGGCTGCGYEMLPGETAEQTLRRMEMERKF